LSNEAPILEINNLRTEFHTEEGIVRAVNGVSHVLYEGETLGIVGESGCGKSVSMLSVMRLLPIPPAKIDEGEVKFFGNDLLKLSDSEMRDIRGAQIAMIFQDPMTSLNPVHTIGFQLTESIILHLGFSKERANERAAELLEMVGIPQAKDRLDDYPHQFSGGMRQRVMIAMALACNPSVLIADEPTTALDVTIQAQIVELVKQLRDQLGMSLIWITHDLALIAGLADRMAVMYAGYVVEASDVDEVYETPRHPYTEALLHSLPGMEKRGEHKLRSIEGAPPDLIALPPGCPFAPRCTYVVDKCLEENPPLTNVSPDHRIACWVDITTGELR
jgi:oligopeptide transport system ATP-binding protein